MKSIIKLYLLIFISANFQAAFAQNAGELFPMRENFKWGYIDKSGEWKIEPEYLRATNFINGVALVGVDPLSWKFIRPTGDFLFDSEISADWSLETSYGGKIPSGLETGNFFSEGLMAIRENYGKYKYINKKGETVFEIECSGANNFSGGLALVRKDGNYGYIDKSGNFVIEPQFRDAEDFSEGLAAVSILKDNEYLWGFIDKSGEFVIEPQFYDAQSFSEGLAMIGLKSAPQESGYYGPKGYINKNGEIVVEPYYYDAMPFSEGLAAVKKSGDWGYIDKTGKIIIPMDLNDAEKFSEGLAAVEIDDEEGRRNAYIDKNGNEVISGKALENSNFLFPFRNGLAMIAYGLPGSMGYFAQGSGEFRYIHDSYYGYIDKKGNLVAAQSEEEQKLIKGKIDSIRAEKERAERKEEEKKEQARQKMLDACPDTLIYGNSAHKNWLEFYVDGKFRKLYFEDVAVEKFPGRYEIIFPDFGYSEEDRKRALSKINAGLFTGMARDMLDHLSQLKIKIDPNDTFDKIEFLQKRIMQLDCFTQATDENLDRLLDGNFNFEKEKTDVKEITKNGKKFAMISFYGPNEEYFLKGNIETSQIIEKSNEPKKINPALREKIISENKYEEREVRINPAENVLRYRTPMSMSRDYEAVPLPEKGKDISVLQTSDSWAQIFKFHKLSDDEVFFDIYSVDLRMLQRDWNNAIFTYPSMKITENLSDIKLDSSNLDVQIYSGEVSKFDLKPLIYEPYDKDELPPVKAELKPLAMNNLPDNDMPEFRDFEEYRAIFNLGNDAGSIISMSKTEFKGKECYAVSVEIPEGKLAEVNLAIAKFKTVTSDEEFEIIRNMGKEILERMDQLRDDEKQAEFIEWLNGKMRKLGIEPPETNEMQMYQMSVSRAFEEKYFDDALDMIFLVGAKKIAEEDIETIEFIYDIAEKNKGFENTEEGIERDAIISIMEKLEIPVDNKKSNEELMNVVEDSLEDRYHERVMELALEMIRQKKKSGGDPQLIIDAETGRPLSNSYGFGYASYDRGVPTTVKIDYAGKSIKLTGENDRQGIDTMTLNVEADLLDMRQFNAVLPFMEIDEDFREKVVLFGLAGYTNYSFSTEEGEDMLAKADPLFAAAEIEYISKETSIAVAEPEELIKLKVSFEGDIRGLPLVNDAEYLKFDEDTGSAYAEYYVSPEFPHYIRKISLRDAEIYVETIK